MVTPSRYETALWTRFSSTRTTLLALAIVIGAVASCKERRPVQNPPRDSGDSGARGDEQNGISFGGSGGHSAGQTDASPRECHAERYFLEGDGSAACVLRFREAIVDVHDVQIRVPDGGSSRYLERGSAEACDAEGWYWSEAPPNGAVLALCDEACAALRAAGVAYVDAMIGCGSPTPMR